MNPSKRNQDAKNWRLIRRTSGGASTSIAEEASCIRGMGFGGRHWRNSIAAKKKKKKRSGFWRILGFPLSRGRSKETRFAWQEEDQEEGNDDDDDDVMTLCYMVRDLFRIWMRAKTTWTKKIHGCCEWVFLNLSLSRSLLLFFVWGLKSGMNRRRHRFWRNSNL